LVRPPGHGLVDAGHIPEVFRFFFVPFVLAPMLHGVLLGRAVGAFSAVFVTLIGCLFVPQGEALGYMILSLVAGVTSVLLAHEVRKRLQLLQTGIYVGAVTLLIGLLLGRLDIASCFGPNAMDHLQMLATGARRHSAPPSSPRCSSADCCHSSKARFHLTTDISWLELSDLNHRCCARCSWKLPEHSTTAWSSPRSPKPPPKKSVPTPRCAAFARISMMSENSKTRLLHRKPARRSGKPARRLTPTMSALIIIAHVKDGVDLAVKHKLNPRIIDVIQEHHGDSLVSFSTTRPANRKNSNSKKWTASWKTRKTCRSWTKRISATPARARAPGKRHHRLADTIESASRTLGKPTPAKHPRWSTTSSARKSRTASSTIARSHSRNWHRQGKLCQHPAQHAPQPHRLPERMEAAQESIVARLWTSALQERLDP
jgi:cyclic-di-AMP phosphodiesterase PgpH